MEILPVTLRRGIASIIVNFLIALLSLFISIIATRKLLPIDFGHYQFLLLISSLFNVAINSFGWFITRFVARGYNVIRETFLYGFLLTLTSDFLLLSVLFMVNIYLFTISFLLITLTFLLFLSQAFLFISMSYVQGINPLKISLASLIQSASRLVLLLFSLFLLSISLSVELFLIVTIIGNLLALAYMLPSVLNFKGASIGALLKNSFLRLWHVSFLLNLSGALIYYDSAIMPILLSSTLPLAFFRSAFIVSIPITYVQALVTYYYRDFLEKGSLKELGQAIKVVFLLSILLGFLVMSIGDVFLAILRPVYISSYPALIFLAISFMIGNVSSLLYSSLISLEKIDIDSYDKKLSRSIFFKVVKIQMGVLAFQYPSLISLAYYARVYEISPESVAMYWAMIWLIMNTLAFSLNYLELKKIQKIQIPFTSLIKYLLVALIPSGLSLLFKPDKIPVELVSQASLALTLVFVYIFSFFFILVMVDKSVRGKFLLILKKFKLVF